MNVLTSRLALILLGILSFSACTDAPKSPDNQQSDKVKLMIANMKLASDPHTYAQPNDARVVHLDWDAEVNFETRVITATASYDIEKSAEADKIILDIHGLSITKVTVNDVPVEFEIGPEKQFLGQPLIIPIGADASRIAVSYTTLPDAEALLWVEGENPFLFTQSQAILARTWIPCQDSPGIRYSYDATVKVPKNLLALMSAENPQQKNETGIYQFKMAQPIPSYLMALAVGNVEFRAIGDRTGVYAVPELIDAAEYEFQEMDDMLLAAEALYGKYVWERYDLLILPPAFPFGGMENPRLTFATPTIIAGDRSLVSLVAHELAHSWSGNLVTNSTWDDFWLNEGFTVYFEQRIMEAVYGRETSEMLAKLSQQGLLEEEVDIRVNENRPNDTKLKFDLTGRNPDDGMTAIPYDKGYFFLRLIEETVGRESWDAFLKQYFTEHSFQVMDTEQFLGYLHDNLLNGEYENAINIDDWVYGVGLPQNMPVVSSDRMAKVDEAAKAWNAGTLASKDLAWDSWVYQERTRFIGQMADNGGAAKMAELDAIYHVVQSGNNEVLFAWLEKSIRNNYEAAYPRLRTFLVNVGRRKFLTPLYRAMKETNKLKMAKEIYEEARPNYHSVSVGTMDELLERGS
jgi:leukotriene-A4 hydrolase